MMKKYMPSGTDRAVSPVIGVVLMVGIVVALGAVVGGAVLGLGVGVGETAPNAQFDSTTDDDGNLESITHVAGDTVDADRLNVNGESLVENSDDLDLGDQLTAGTTANINEEAGSAFEGEDAYELQWVSENGETSAVLATF